MGRESRLIRMAVSIRERIKMIKSMDMGRILGQMERCMMGAGSMESKREKPISQARQERSGVVSGTMVNEFNG